MYTKTNPPQVTPNAVITITLFTIPDGQPASLVKIRHLSIPLSDALRLAIIALLDRLVRRIRIW